MKKKNFMNIYESIFKMEIFSAKKNHFFFQRCEKTRMRESYESVVSIVKRIFS